MHLEFLVKERLIVLIEDLFVETVPLRFGECVVAFERVIDLLVVIFDLF